MAMLTDLSRTDLESLCNTLGVSAHDVAVTALSGGLYERSYRLSSDQGDWVARLPIAVGVPCGLEFSAEQRLLSGLGAAGLTPPIVPSEGILITRYVSQVTNWCAADVREPSNILRVAKRLRDLHQAAHDLPPFRAIRIAEDYRRLAENGRRLTTEQRDWGREMLHLARAYDTESSPATLCHNDLVAANILDDGQLWFIDFEYAVCAEPILDLASLVSMNDFDATQQACLIETYYQSAAPPFSMKKFADVIRLTGLISLFWALAVRCAGRENVLVDRFVEKLAAVLR